MFDSRDLKYLKLLSKKFPNIEETATEIINLEAILSLPKGTEHFISDIHGEYDAFNHILKNCSGVIKDKIEKVFTGTIREEEKRELATVIYYPKEKIEILEKKEKNMKEWYYITINRILKILELVSSKYTRSKVAKALNKDFSYIIQELLYERREEKNKKGYIDGIVDTIIEIDRGKEFIISVSNLIQRLTIDNLHIVGDIYDRGAYPHKILDKLIGYHNVDIQWGNHDILWIGAGCGEEACIANAIRICLRYSNREILEEGYGINLLPLASFALKYYKDDISQEFLPKVKEKDIVLTSKMHKAIAIIQFKLEGEIIKRNPEFKMESRRLLEKIDYDRGIIKIGSKEYKLKDNRFPTIDKNNPFKLIEEEREIIDGLVRSFKNSEKLQEHIRFLLDKGGMYLVKNGNLMFHGCVPLSKKGDIEEVDIIGEKYKGKEYFDICEQICREGYYNKDKIKERDFIWYLWCGEKSPLFGKDAMKTFERYFLDEKETHKENYNSYYEFIKEKTVAEKILKEFGVDSECGIIVNGHVPVKVKKGENPIKGEGKVLLIDGGFSRAYQETTGIAGYTLIFNSYGTRLVSHRAFKGIKEAVEECVDIEGVSQIIYTKGRRILVRDTDIGKELEEQSLELKKLLYCYRNGILKENFKG